LSRNRTLCPDRLRLHYGSEGKVPSAQRPPVDELDGRILNLFSTEPRVGVLEASRRLRLARGTVQARLNRLERDGVVVSWAPRISPAALGYSVTAFVTLEIVQHEGRDELTSRLTQIPEVLECWTVTGPGDLWCRVVARSNADLQRVIDSMVTDPSVVRSVSLVGLAEPIPYRTEPLVLSATELDAPRGPVTAD
jgi:DNA-binding Lrp family transcriptional regulator